MKEAYWLIRCVLLGNKLKRAEIKDYFADPKTVSQAEPPYQPPKSMWL